MFVIIYLNVSWLSRQRLSSPLALCQTLPPQSSQFHVTLWITSYVCVIFAQRFDQSTGFKHAAPKWSNAPKASWSKFQCHKLSKEKLGYVVQKMVNGSASFHSFFALAGCTRPTNYTHRGCSQDSTTRAHISVEVWTAGGARCEGANRRTAGG